ncbi:glutaredoxin-like protein NrdH [Bombilactobacillus thymidiniphilus]|uniref:Glutaredoxin-like protein NrdH n=1 Tax=Bombilactobacillus thymidiniphilus TaxID=2923363 RepID=A0ABY4PF49_9LACO|nr:glutaredoxin-like protein NrdH [Bombilactobacillus thymidiniphilus]UQS84144.1 glutaredoxin-like protein NrdH [Bombilactobacillus thymidiniphilus]
MKATIQVFTKNGCIQCKMTKKFLAQNNINFEEYNVNEQPEYVDFLKQKGFQSLPVVFVPSKEAIVGFRPDQLKELVL